MTLVEILYIVGTAIVGIGIGRGIPQYNKTTGSGGGGPSGDAYLLEDGSGYYLMEDGSYYLKE